MLDGRVGEVIRFTGEASITDWAGNPVPVVQEGSTRLAVMGAYFQTYKTLAIGDLDDITDPANPDELGGFIADGSSGNPFYQQPDKPYWQGYSLPAFRQAVTGVQVYKVYYNSIIPERGNRPILASGLLAVPQNAAGTVDIVSYQHGTLFAKQEVPSHSLDKNTAWYPGSYEGRLAVAAFGGQGSTVIEADYFGMAESTEPEGYTVKASHQQACLDLYQAAGKFLEANGLRQGQLHLSGWSQGGLVTMQFLEKLQSLGVEVGKVGTAAAPSATFAAATRILFNPRVGSDTGVPDAQWLNFLFVLTPFSYENYYKKPGFARSVIDPLYYETVKALYERSGDMGQLLATLPPITPRPGGMGGVIDLFRPEYADKAYFSSSELAECYRQVSAYEFLVKTPVRMHGGAQDEAFPLSVTMQPAQFQDIFNPGWVTGIEVPAASHRGTFLTAIADQVEWFAGRQDNGLGYFSPV
jgi:pimeloyl-ACP methyl ester carboxylesterase